MGINEFAASSLVGKALDKADATDLACFGAYNPVTETQDSRFLEEVLSPGGLRFLSLAQPFTVAGLTPPGRYPDGNRGIPVAYPVGDNQAGFFGLLSRPQESCLISIGTSGQISVYSSLPQCPPSMELRPYLGQGYLWVGATLCAGKAYEVLAEFLREVIRRYSPGPVDDEAVFTMMKQAAREVIPSVERGLRIETTINGTRQDGNKRGSVTNISLDNLNLGNLVLGTIDGVVRELADFRNALGAVFDPVRSIVVSGSAVRKNPLFAQELAQQFGLEISIPPFDGAAALGAALIGATAAGNISLQDVSGLVEGFWRQGTH
jgi:sedoheptulokinase